LIVRKVAEMREQLDRELVRTQHFQNAIQHRRSLRLECLRLDKQMLEAQGKVKALEEELEVPLNVHRWRFLEGTNPEAFQMIKMTHALRTKCMVKISALRRARNELQRARMESEAIGHHLVSSTTAENTAAFDLYNDVLKQKSRQLDTLESQVIEQQPYLDESKSNVEVMRAQIRDAKGAFYSEKTSLNDLIARSNLLRKSEGQAIVPHRSFIGGGFPAFPSLARTSFDSPTATSDQSMVTSRSSVIVVPKLSANAPLIPRGWNPTRKPLQPRFPAAAHPK
jgi:hypothetical protein